MKKNKKPTATKQEVINLLVKTIYMATDVDYKQVADRLDFDDEYTDSTKQFIRCFLYSRKYPDIILAQKVMFENEKDAGEPSVIAFRVETCSDPSKDTFAVDFVDRLYSGFLPAPSRTIIEMAASSFDPFKWVKKAQE